MCDDTARAQLADERLGGFIARRFVADAAEAEAGGVVERTDGVRF
jgi:hypothetical protein